VKKTPMARMTIIKAPKTVPYRKNMLETKMIVRVRSLFILS